MLSASAIGCGSGEVEIDATITGDDSIATVDTPRVDTIRKPVVHDTIVQPTTTVRDSNDTNAPPRNRFPMDRPNVTAADQQRIDAWLTAYADSLNDYGDPEGTMYAGGTPLFNETSGKPVSKYEYIVANHPERPWDKTLPAKSK
ncbi:MAG: hypothetical protein H7X80_01920 [bacterium]|nr:hypothetical protein [Candidatus Kapabacteria bacterium]